MNEFVANRLGHGRRRTRARDGDGDAGYDAAMHRYIMALDQGTTSSRALLVRRDGSIAAKAQQEIAAIGIAVQREPSTDHAALALMDRPLIVCSAASFLLLPSRIFGSSDSSRISSVWRDRTANGVAQPFADSLTLRPPIAHSRTASVLQSAGKCRR